MSFNPVNPFRLRKKVISRQTEPEKINSGHSTSIDYVLLVLVICLSIAGLLALLSASDRISEARYADRFLLVKNQMFFFVGGLVCLRLASRFNYQFFNDFAPLIYLLSIGLLFVVLLPNVGVAIGGARQWFRIGPLLFSPSAFAGLAVVLYLARYLSREAETIYRKIHVLIFAYVVAGLPTGLALLQPDLSAAAVYLLSAILMYRLAGGRAMYLAVSLVFLPLPLLLSVIAAEYRLRRLLAFLDPNSEASGAGFQIIQSYIALGSGGLTGVGFGEGVQKHFYLPEIHNTFILAHVGEEAGFVGVLVVAALLTGIVLRGFLIAVRAQETFGQMLAAGITIWIAVQAILNMGVVSGLLPTAGVNFPFVSHGGNGLLFHLLSIGILLNVSYQTKRYTDYWALVSGPATQFLLRAVKGLSLAVDELERSTIYRMVAIAAVILTLLVGSIQLVFWFLLGHE